MDNKRQTITLTRDFYNATKWMKDESRLEFYDTVFRSLFDNKAIEFEKIKSENVVSALAILTPMLKTITSKFENRVGKKLKENPIPFKSAKISNESERIGTKNNGNFSSDYYNIYNIIYNIYNIYQSSINNNNKLKYIKYENLTLLQNSINQINQQCNEKTVKKLNQVVEKLSATEVVKINGVSKNSVEVLDSITALLLRPTAPSQISEKVAELNSITGIRNPVGYLLTALYNLSQETYQPTTHPIARPSQTSNTFPKSPQAHPYYDANQEIMCHNYTSAQLHAVFDDLDSIEI